MISRGAGRTRARRESPGELRAGDVPVRVRRKGDRRRVSIRHALTPFLERVGGHIGYVVVPEYRRQGYATAILRQSLQIARQKLGLTRVLLTCDDDNIGSIRVIEKNRGILESVVTGTNGETSKRRYWIATEGLRLGSGLE